MKTTKSQFFVEMTDTYGGEANYCWVNRFLVTASSERGAISKVTRKTGYHARNAGCDRYDVPGAAICYFVQWIDADDAQRYAEQYSRIETI